MGSIKVLPKEVVARIAAGEVIENPASVVKELIDNALDAGANIIDISLSNYGLERIEVRDNGIGMDKVDINLSTVLHATSKLVDFDNISSLGFRGEALASISSIANVTITSRQAKNQYGTGVQLQEGKSHEISKVGMPAGTHISVTQLFAHTPARKKYLKTTLSEYRHIVDVVSSYALAYPEITFTLTNDNKLALTTDGVKTVEDMSILLLGSDLEQNLISISNQEGYIEISGVISRPQIQTTSARKVYLNVNGRPVTSPIILQAIKDGYSSLLAPGSYPTSVLQVTVPTERIDVNVHPRKETIRFIEDEVMYQTIKNTISETLAKHNLTFYNLSWKKSETHSPLAQELKKDVLPQKELLPTNWIQVHNMYLIGESIEGIVILDQHAAHERILFEQFKEVYKQKSEKNKSIQLTPSVLIHLSYTDKALYFAHEEFFKKVGFVVEDFGDNDLKINEIPASFERRNVTGLLSELLNDLAENKIPRDIDQQTYLLLSYLACRSAIKAGDVLTNEEIQSLVSELSLLDTAYTCPHGRPLKIAMTLKELSKMFKRT